MPLSLPVMLLAAILSSPALSGGTEVQIHDCDRDDVHSSLGTTIAAEVSIEGAVDPSQPALAPVSSTGATSASQDEVVVTAHKRDNSGDPLHEINQQSFEATQRVDQAVVEPVAVAYVRHVPAPVRTGVRNFLKNLREPIVFVNFVVQIKPVSAAKTAGRFALNSTLGVVGLVDIAKRRPFNLPGRHNGFADTLGYYGVKPGPYFFVPLFGPTTLRDAIGAVADSSLLITAIGTPFDQPSYTVPAGALGAVDRRIAFDEDLRRIRGDTADAYGARRTFYLCKRQAEIDALHERRPDTKSTPQQSDVYVGAPTSSKLQCNSLPPSDATEAIIAAPAKNP